MEVLKKIRAAINWKYILFIFLFTLFAIEIFSRIYFAVILKKSPSPKFQFNSYRIYSHIPGFHEGDGKRDWIVINKEGFRRTTEVSLKKPPHTFRAFLLGGSAAHGITSAAPYPIVHIYPDETIDAYLEKELKQKHPGYNIEIINAAVTGYQVFQHTAYILSELLDYSPDAIIFFDGVNDHATTNSDYNYYGDNIYQFWEPRLTHPSIGGIFDYSINWLAKYSCAARGYMAWKLNRDASNRERNTDLLTREGKFPSRDAFIAAHKEVAKRQFLRSIETNIVILKTYGIDCIICFQPILALRDSSLLSVSEKVFASYKNDSEWPVLYPAIINELTTLTQKYKIPFINVNRHFNSPGYKGKQLLIDYCHLTPAGGEASANAILPAIDSIVSKRIVADSLKQSHP